MRYCKQTTAMSCGPIAVLNAMKWFGKKVTKRGDLPFLKWKTGCDRLGTSHEGLDECLSSEFRSCVLNVPPSELTIKDVKGHVASGGSCIISYGYIEDEKVHGHICFISQCQGYYLLVHNHTPYEPHLWVREEEIEKWLSDDLVEEDGTEYPCVWFLVKE